MSKVKFGDLPQIFMPNPDIRNLSFEELVQYFNSIGQKSFRAIQIFKWIYHRGVTSFDKMKNLPKDLRTQISQQLTLNLLKISTKQISEDGTVKFLFELDDREKIETVLIPTKTRNTICVSTQVGCKFGCAFCASGIDGWKRNLSTAEILAQILWVKNYVGAQDFEPLQRISHIVFMGVGEPLDNYDNLMKAIRIINDKNALNIGARRITVSTCGVIPKIKKLSKEGLQIELAISLHGYDNESRNALMPVNRKYPFDKLMEACKKYSEMTNRQITFEYILIKDVTCSDKAIRKLKKAFKGLICKMNLIPYNSVAEFKYGKLFNKEIKDFKEKLEEIGIHSTVRALRGGDISGACGQLRHGK